MRLILRGLRRLPVILHRVCFRADLAALPHFRYTVRHRTTVLLSRLHTAHAALHAAFRPLS